VLKCGRNPKVEWSSWCLDSQELAKEHPSDYSSIYTRILSGYVLRFEYRKGNYAAGCGLCILRTVDCELRTEIKGK
jgi:hypothetical protein